MPATRLPVVIDLHLSSSTSRRENMPGLRAARHSLLATAFRRNARRARQSLCDSTQSLPVSVSRVFTGGSYLDFRQKTTFYPDSVRRAIVISIPRLEQAQLSICASNIRLGSTWRAILTSSPFALCRLQRHGSARLAALPIFARFCLHAPFLLPSLFRLASSLFIFPYTSRNSDTLFSLRSIRAPTNQAVYGLRSRRDPDPQLTSPLFVSPSHATHELASHELHVSCP